MKRIIKTNPPQKFSFWLNKGNRTWDSLKRNNTIKKDLKEQLLLDQGYICCYCGKRIINNDLTTIEHIKPKGKNPSLSLDYNNLLASCNGGRDDRHNTETSPIYCDAHKDEDDILINPLIQNCEDYFIYGEYGEVFGIDNNIDETIKVLNLNNEILINRRREVLEPFLEVQDSSEIQSLIDYYDKKDNSGQYEEYCHIIKKVLENLL